MMQPSSRHLKNARKCCAACILLFLSPLLHPQEIAFPLIQALAWMPPAENNLLPPRSRVWSVSLADANLFSFSRDQAVINDMSIFSLYFSYRRGLSAGLTLEVFAGARFYYDSGADQLIKKVDHALGFSDSGRDVFPERTIHYKFKDHFYYNRDRWVPAPLVLGLTGKIFRLGNMALNGRLNLGIPLSDQPGFSSKKVFALAGLMFEYAKNKLAVSAALQMGFFKSPTWLTNEKIDHYYSQATFKIRLSHFLLGAIFRTSPLHFGENGNSGKMIYVGYLIKNRFEIGFMEDLPPMDTVPDVAVYLKIHLNRLQP